MENANQTAPASPDLDQAAKEECELLRSKGPPMWVDDDVRQAFKAGAAWQAGQNPKAGDMTDIPVKRLQDLDACFKQSVDVKSTHSDPYLRGYANGVILAHAIINGTDPDFIDAPTAEIKQWAEDVRKREPDRLVPRYHAEEGEFGEGATVAARGPVPGVYSEEQARRCGGEQPKQVHQIHGRKLDPLDVLKMEDLSDKILRDAVSYGVGYAVRDGDKLRHVERSEVAREGSIAEERDMLRQTVKAMAKDLDRAQMLYRTWRAIAGARGEAINSLGKMIDDLAQIEERE